MANYPRPNYNSNKVVVISSGVPGPQVVTYSSSPTTRPGISSVLRDVSKNVAGSREVQTAKDYLTGEKAKTHLSIACKAASGFLDTASKSIGGTQTTMVNGQPVDQQILTTFMTVDLNKSGHINAEQLQRAILFSTQTHLSHETCAKLITFFDRRQSGFINVNEFQQLFQMFNNWKTTFDGYDTDRKGSVDQSQLQRALKHLGHNVSTQFTNNILRTYNPRTKRITLDQFIFICVEMKRLSDRFRARDAGLSGHANMQYEEFVSVSMGLSS